MTQTIYTKRLLLHSNPILMQILILSKVVSYDSVIIHTGEKMYFILCPFTTFTKFCVSVTRYQGLCLSICTYACTRSMRILSASRTIKQSISRTGSIGDVVRSTHAHKTQGFYAFLGFLGRNDSMLSADEMTIICG